MLKFNAFIYKFICFRGRPTDFFFSKMFALLGEAFGAVGFAGRPRLRFVGSSTKGLHLLSLEVEDKE